ncbi:AAA family ATPase [Actinoplanes sp. NPDC024001]|uniref:helix-turn-helix transcriptional regulator n=1 Tax=Actinoplanes sp. NPDC024001 TaxID=3154598 RepID=UPI003406A315
MAGVPVIGRETERELLSSSLRAVRREASRVHVVTGDPGVGKTALIESVLADMPEMRLLRLRGVQVEQDLPFAAVQRLLRGHEERVAALPDPYREPLLAIVGMELDRQVNRAVLGMALLALLTELSAAGPVVCWVDDAHWLDTESAAALTFVARRLRSERIAMLFATRPDSGPAVFTDLPALPLGGLAAEPARQLLRSVVEQPVDAGVADRIVTAVGGNPLAIVDLSRELTTGQLTGRSALPEPVPVGDTLEQHYLRHVERLPDDTRLWLLIAAAEDTGDGATIARAAQALGLQASSAEPAEQARLIRYGGYVEFRHPLVRAAVYNAASTVQRRRVHAALAGALSGARDAERRVWHLAAAADGPDETVAAQLEAAAERTGDAGGSTGRAALLVRAAALSGEGEGRIARTLAALESSVRAGAYVQADALLQSLAGHRLAGAARGRVLVASARTAVMLSAPGAGARRPAMLMEAASAFGGGLACRDALFEAFLEALTADDLIEGTSLPAIARRVRDSAGDLPGTVGCLLLAHATAVLDGVAAAAGPLRDAVRGYLDPSMSDDDVILAARAAMWAAHLLWDSDLRLRVLDRAETVMRRRGALFDLVHLLNSRAICITDEGRLRTATALMSEAEQVRLSIEMAPHMVGYHLVNPELAALLGEETLLREQHEAAVAGMTYVGAGALVTSHRIALMLLEISRGDYPAADVIARRLDHGPSTRTGIRALPDLVECASRVGDRGRARGLLARFAEHARAGGTDRAAGLLARCQALVSTDETAERHYLRAVECSAAVPLDLARTHLLYGEWLRRQRRRRDARSQLRAAADLFDTIGARLFGDRARSEIEATGHRVPARPASGSDALTPQETAVAELARTGATNHDIANRLFISPNTVDYHLRKVFRKLAVTSRRQLDDVLPRDS